MVGAELPSSDTGGDRQHTERSTELSLDICGGYKYRKVEWMDICGKMTSSRRDRQTSQAGINADVATATGRRAPMEYINSRQSSKKLDTSHRALDPITLPPLFVCSTPLVGQTSDIAAYIDLWMHLRFKIARGASTRCVAQALSWKTIKVHSVAIAASKTEVYSAIHLCLGRAAFAFVDIWTKVFVRGN
ncbi:unnamed protein product [Calypogeia fissa]